MQLSNIQLIKRDLQRYLRKSGLNYSTSSGQTLYKNWVIHYENNLDVYLRCYYPTPPSQLSKPNLCLCYSSAEKIVKKLDDFSASFQNFSLSKYKNYAKN